MADIIPLVRPEAVDEAWGRFQAHAQRLVSDRTLLANRQFMEELAALERSWKHLFWAARP